MRTALPLYVLWLASTTVWWALALAPLPGTSPDWLLRTRNLCFGAWPNGVPDAAGWITLLSPVPMLVAVIVLQGRELRDDLRRLPRPVAGLLLLLPLVGMLGAGVRLQQAYQVQAARNAPAGDDLPLPSDYPTTARPMPEFHLVDQRGQRVTPSTLRGRPVLLTFAYAHCATICPTVLNTLRQVSGPARLVVVTLDPRRDTPSSLPDLAQAWQLPPQGLALSGEVAEVEKAAREFGVPAQRDLQTGEIVHPGLVFVVDAAGRIVYTFNNPRVEWLNEALRRACPQT